MLGGDPFRLAFEAARDFQLLVDEAGSVLAVSEGYLHATGLSRDSVVGQMLRDFPPYAGSAAAIRLLEETLSRTHELKIPSSTPIPHPAPCAAGTVFTRAMNTPLFDAERRVNYVVHRLEATVEEAAGETAQGRRFRKLVENDFDAIVLSDAMGRVTFASPSIERITGYTPEDYMVRPRAADLHPDDAASAALAARAALSQPGRVSVTRLRRMHRDGAYRTIELTLVNHLHDPDVNSIVLTLHDVTEQVQQRLLEENLRESQKLESLGVLAGGIAHDFNNLLATIIGNVGLMMEEAEGDRDRLGQLGQVDTAARRAADLCKQMLAYAGKASIALSRTDLNRIIDETAQLLRVSIGKKVDLRLKLSRDLLPISADVTQMQQVLMNLIINASDAIGNQMGTITLTTDVIHADRNYIEQSRLAPEISEGTYVRLDVTDTGPGMPVEVQQRIFDPFFSTKGMGRGLGLAAVRGIVRSHGGALRLYSESGKGTTFKLLFPVAKGAPLHDAVEADVEQPLASAGAILLVEDETALRAVARRMIAKLGLRVIDATDGRHAVEVFQRHQSEIVGVLMDLTMPNMSGEEALRELLRIDPSVRVLLMSGYSKRDLPHPTEAPGPVGFMQKPFTMKELKTQLRKLVSGAS